ncbi:MAG: hypothetical protein H0V07_11745, partial [Propionibacteriales bacterium]|nr:hypothetical protein [Propionibacteriales bacterium]
MVADAVKKRRDVLAFGLLGVASLYLVSGMVLVFSAGVDSVGSYAARASAFGYLFSHPVLVSCLVAAVGLVVGFGEVSRKARAVVLAGLVIGGLALVLAVVCWFSGLAAQEDLVGRLFGGVFGAGKAVGIFLGLAQLGFLALAVVFAFVVFTALPTTAPRAQPQWGSQLGYGPQQGFPSGQQYGPAQSSYGPPQGWGQPGPGYPQSSQQGWG